MFPDKSPYFDISNASAFFVSTIVPFDSKISNPSIEDTKSINARSTSVIFSYIYTISNGRATEYFPSNTFSAVASTPSTVNPLIFP